MPGSTLNMLVLGDSVAWGQGLQSAEKFHSLVKAGIEQRTPGVTVPPPIVRAHSGAVICTSNQKLGDPECSATDPVVCGEVPTSRPSIIRQCNEFVGPPTRDQIDLVLVDGGSNDVSILNILNPWVSTATLETRIAQFCGEAMKELLAAVCVKFPNARIIVTGYYPMVSLDSNLILLELALSLMLGPLVLGGMIFAEWMRQNIHVNCQYFAERSSSMLYWAVADQRTALSRQIDFADVYSNGFDWTRSVLATNSWLFGINATGTPQDTVNRQTICNTKWASNQDQLSLCRVASLGHPNPQGARKYADVVLGILFPHRLAVHVSPSLVQLGVPTSVVISAEDVLTHAPVAGRVKLRNFDALGRPVYATFPTETEYAATFREGMIRVFDPELRKWVPEECSPSAVVSATSYSSVEVPFGW